VLSSIIATLAVLIALAAMKDAQQARVTARKALNKPSLTLKYSMERPVKNPGPEPALPQFIQQPGGAYDN